MQCSLEGAAAEPEQAGRLGLTGTSSHPDQSLVDQKGLPRRDVILLLCALAFAHAPILINNGLIADDWLIFRIKPGYPAQIDFMLHGAGHPIVYVYCALANLSGHPIAFMKTMAIIGVAIGAINLRAFLGRLRVFSDFEAQFLTLLVWTYAGFQVWTAKLLATYIFSLALVFLGLNLFAAIAASKSPPIWWRPLSLIALFCSFAINSMMVVYLIGLLAVLFASPLGDRRRLASLPLLKRWVDFLALPFVYWFSTRLLFPRSGPYAEYYRARIPDLDTTLAAAGQFVEQGTYRLLEQATTLASETHRLFAIVALAGLAFVALSFRVERTGLSWRDGLISAAWLMVAGLTTFAVLLLPYIAIGAVPTGHFYESRHLLLFGIPLGLLAVSVLRILRSVPGTTPFALTAVVLLLTVNLCSLWDGYFHQQARWLRQNALIHGLQRAYREPPAAVFNLIDYFLEHPTHTWFGMSEVTGILHAAWDNRPLLGFLARNEPATILQDVDKMKKMPGSAFSNVDPWGLQARIELIPREPVLTNYRLSLQYYRCLVSFCETGKLTDALAETRVQVGPIPRVLGPKLD
ncbi:hypothetical protein [Bradyrhizobium iriomotense]|uniref:DUF2723 domain-containing protein n=1 Tax=Bradyrhizobium iriomotense TaxID=441950 RepID=A0ABQ6B002_9BRAD|nr:hypothetical protein [Bradyrhizobium iriomotense]GLR85478.1 hypothetical protein GCM10007857_21890 [Bradyrhizobium iriomotense]